MTQPSVGPEKRGDAIPYTTQPGTPAETVGFMKHNPPAEPTPENIHRRLNAENPSGPTPTSFETHNIAILDARCVRLNSENIDLRAQLEMARKATSAAQELLEAERVEVAKIEDELKKERGFFEQERAAKYRLMSALDIEKLLRVNDAGTIADLQRRLREAEGQLKAQRLSPTLAGPAIGMMEIPAALWRERMAENAELRRTISLMAKTAAEVQDNFRLIADLASDPADEKRKEPKP